MRHLLRGFGVLILGATAAAAQDAPKPFITASPSVAVIRHPGTERTINVGFDATVGGPSLHRFQTFGTAGKGVGIGTWNPSWYATGGGRYAMPTLWRFRPYVDGSVGVARMAFNGERPLTPLVSTGFGVHLPIGQLFTLDVGYRAQRFLGNADNTRRYPVLGFGMSF